MAQGKRTTIVDVAASAGVSIKSVSRALNNEPHVSDELKRRVLASAKALKYEPNVVAQGLAGRRSYMLGLVYENPSANYIVELQKGALDRLHGERYRLVVLPVESIDEVRDRVLALVRSGALDGVVLAPPASDHPPTIEALRDGHIPFTRIGATRFPDASPNTVIDDLDAACEMTRYLIGLGHREIGLIKGVSTHSATEARLMGFSKALAEAGISPRLDLIEQGEFDFESGLVAGRRLLDRPDRPTAIFAQNDDMACGALMAAHDLGIAVPRDVSIVGFDDSQIAREIWPRITTIHQPVQDMARTATDMLVALLEKKPISWLVRHSFEMIIRQSSGPAKSRDQAAQH